MLVCGGFHFVRQACWLLGWNDGQDLLWFNCIRWSVLSLTSDVSYFQLPRHAWCWKTYQSCATEASQRPNLPTSLDLTLCSWVEGSIYETSLLICCAKWWTRFVVVEPYVVKCTLLNKWCISISNFQLHVVRNDSKFSKNVCNFVEKERSLWFIVYAINHHQCKMCTCNIRMTCALCSSNDPWYFERFLGWEIIRWALIKA